MRIARVLGTVLAVLLAGLLVAPSASSEPPFRLPTQVTDQAGALSSSERDEVQQAVDRLFDDRHIQLWVVYVKSFDGQNWLSWAENTMKISDFGDDDALLAVATEDRAFAFQVPSTVSGGKSTSTDEIRRNDIEPALRRNDFSGAAVAAANGLNSSGSNVDTGASVSIVPLLIVLGVLVLLALLLWIVAATAQAQAARGRGRRGQAGGPHRPQRVGVGAARGARRPVQDDRRRRRQRGAHQ